MNDDEDSKIEEIKEEEKDGQEKPVKKKKDNALVYIVIAIILAYLAFYPQYIGAVIILVIGSIVSLGIIWFLLAPENILWNFTKESTGKIRIRGGSFVGALIQMTGYTYDQNWNVIPEDENHKEPRHLGALRFNGIPFLDTILEYGMRWHSFRLQEGEETVKFHEEERLTAISLKKEQYSIKINRAETAPPERIPLNIEFVLRMKIVNPYKVFFSAPYNVIENAIITMSALLTNWVGTKKFDDILEVQKNPDLLWKDIGEHELIKVVLYRDQGLLIESNGIQIRRVDPPRDIQEAAAEEKKQKMAAAGRSEKTVGTLLATMAHATGKTIEEIQKEIESNPVLRKQFLEIGIDLVQRQIAIEGGSFLDIRSGGKEGAENSLLNAFAAYKRIPEGNKKKEDPETEKEKKEVSKNE